MGSFIVRRLLLAVLTLLGISFITFMTVFLVPADPARVIAGEKATEQIVDSIRHQLGLDQPIYVQYIRYLWGLLHGDFGYSYVRKAPVLPHILHFFPATLKLGAAAALAQLAIGLPIGLVSALKRYSWVDRLSMLFALISLATPRFWLGLLLIYFLAFLLGLFPLGGYGGLKHMALPTLAMGITGSAWYARMFRSSTLDEVRADYVRTARGKGLRERAIMLRHIMPNAIRPVITMWGMDLGYFLGGIVVVETVFNWPGIGLQAWKAVRYLDIPMIMGTVLFASVFIIFSNICVDMSYAWLDPRVRLQ